MTRSQFTLYTALFGVSAIIPTAQAGIPGDYDYKKDEKKCGDLKIEVEEIDVDDKKVTVEGELMCLDEKKDAKVFVKAKALAKVACQNPAGKYPAGQQGKVVPVTLVGSETIDEYKIDGKSTDFKVVADDIKGFKSPCPPPFKAHIKEIHVKEVKVVAVQDGEVADTKCEVKNNGDDFWCD